MWNLLENILDPKKKWPPDGFLLELKKGFCELCNCRELVIIISMPALSSHGNKEIATFISFDQIFFKIKSRQLLWYESLEVKLIKPLHIINVVRLIKLATFR